MTTSSGSRHVLTTPVSLSTPQKSFGPLLLFDPTNPSAAGRNGFVMNNVALPGAAFYGHRLAALATASDLATGSSAVGLVASGPIRPCNQCEMQFYVGHSSEADNTDATAYVWLEYMLQYGKAVEYLYRPAFAISVVGGATDVAAGSQVLPSAGSSALASVNWCDSLTVTGDRTYRGTAVVGPDPASADDSIASVVFDVLGASGLAVAMKRGSAGGVGAVLREL